MKAEVNPYTDSPFRIMMVDDVVRHQRLYEATITDAIPSTVEFATNGEEALQKIDPTTPPDLLILDLNMPKLGGEEVLRRLRQDSAYDRMPVIILTGETDVACHHRLLDLGADDFVEKGCSPEIFVARLKNQIKHKQSLDRFTQLAVDMDMFAAGVLHDIRNLESVIVAVCHLSSELMTEDPVSNQAQVLNDLESLESRARKLGIYARDIIQMVRETQKKIELGPQSIVEAANWCLEVLQSSGPESQSSQMQLDLVQPLVPVLADPQFLRLALLNIIANSIKFARKGIAPRLRISQIEINSAGIGRGTVVTRLQDNGTGISEDDLRRVFEPFSRGNARKTRDESVDGFGLGLAMVAKVISNMSGRVWAERPKDGAPGTILCIELPSPAGQPI